jgi:hypothetical protein
MPNCHRLPHLSLLLTLVLCIPLAARADDASRHVKAAQMVTLLHTESMVQQASATILKQVSDAAEKAAGPTPTPQSKAQLADFEKKASQMIDAQVGWKTLEPAITDLYAKTFTEQELDVIVAFFKTPESAAFLEKMPQINDQVEQLATSRLTILKPQINQALEDFSKSQALPPAATAAPSTAPASATPAPAATKPAASPTPSAGKSK